GILFVLRTGVPWQLLPRELGCGSGMTCWRRLRDWQLAGVWDLMHFALLDWLARNDQIDWSRAVVDSCSVRAVYGGNLTGPNPTDRAKRGSKRHLICDGRGPERLAGGPGLGRCDPTLAQRTRAIAAAAGLCARGSRVRRGSDSARSPDSSHRALAGHAPHGAWVWIGPVAVGRGAHICLAESLPPTPRPLRQAGRHPRGVPVTWLCADLLAASPKELDDGLSGRPVLLCLNMDRAGRADAVPGRPTAQGRCQTLKVALPPKAFAPAQAIRILVASDQA